MRRNHPVPAADACEVDAGTAYAPQRGVIPLAGSSIVQGYRPGKDAEPEEQRFWRQGYPEPPVVDRVEEKEQAIKNNAAKLGDAIVDALRAKYTEQERIEVDALNKSVDHLRNTTNRKITLWNKQLKARLRSLGEETNALVLQKQNEIDELNQRTEDENKLLKESKYQKDLASKQDELRLAEDAEERSRIQEQIDEMVARHERERILERREIQIEGLREEIEQIKDHADKKAEFMKTEFENKVANAEKQTEVQVRLFKREIENTKKHYAKLLEADALEAEARLILITKNNDEIIELLGTYNKEWFDKGSSFGQKLVDGIRSKHGAIQRAVQESLSLLRAPAFGITGSAGTVPGRVFSGVGPKSFTDTVASMPKFDKGTNYVPRDMIAMLHKGEAVIPKEYNTEGSPTSGNNVTINITGNTISRQMDVNRIGEDMVRKLRTAGVSF